MYKEFIIEIGFSILELNPFTNSHWRLLAAFWIPPIELFTISSSKQSVNSSFIKAYKEMQKDLSITDSRYVYSYKIYLKNIIILYKEYLMHLIELVIK